MAAGYADELPKPFGHKLLEFLLLELGIEIHLSNNHLFLLGNKRESGTSFTAYILSFPYSHILTPRLAELKRISQPRPSSKSNLKRTSTSYYYSSSFAVMPVEHKSVREKGRSKRSATETSLR